jgi:heat shock protein HslJ
MSKILLVILLSLSFNMESCKETNMQNENGLIGDWLLDSVFLSDAIDSPCGWEAGQHEPLTFEVTKEGESYSFSGNSAVNAFFGSLEILSFDEASRAGQLKVGPIGSTKKAGPPELMNCEQRYLGFMEGANDFSITDAGELHLGNFRKPDSHPRDGGTYLIFKKTQ